MIRNPQGFCLAAACAAALGWLSGCSSSEPEPDTQPAAGSDAAVATDSGSPPATPDASTDASAPAPDATDGRAPPVDSSLPPADAPAPIDASPEASRPDAAPFDAAAYGSRFSGNPIIHSIYTADPTARVWADGRIYLYPSHDIDPPQGCDLMDRYHVYSSSNMVDWVDEGEILKASQVSWGRPEGGFMWAPDCAFKNGTYYFYYPHPSGTDWGTTWKIGVASSKSPAKDFVDQGYIKNIDGLIDPAAFVDDDGQAYLYIGGGGKIQGGKLKENMIEIDGAMQPMTGLTDFHEATWVHKRNGLYYLSYADNHSDATGDNQMRYATSSAPLGPWTYRGVILGPTDSFCTHGSIVQFHDQWYLFYFNSAVSKQDWLRSVAIERLYYNADGTIQPVVQTTQGVPAVGPPESQPLLGTYEAEAATVTTAAVAVDAAASGGKVVGQLHLTNAQVQLDNVDGGKGGRATVHLYYASSETAKLRLAVNGTDYSFINTPATGGWNKYGGHSYLTVVLKAGATNTLRLTGGAGGVNLDYVTVTGFAGD